MRTAGLMFDMAALGENTMADPKKQAWGTKAGISDSPGLFRSDNPDRRMRGDQRTSNIFLIRNLPSD